MLLSVLAYLLGSVSSAIIVCRLSGLPDPRSEGSKNPGATNVLRLGGKKLAALTLLGDVLKGFIAVKITMWIDPSPAIVASVILAVFLGHLYPIFFNFEGGKGVATAFGAILGLSWASGGTLIIIWILIAYLSHYSSLASIITALLAPFFVGYFMNWHYAIPVAVMSIILLWRHRGNIDRLLKGVEPKVDMKRS
jgi:glycerol-3-phosphate acyltransferase PlsY